MEFPGTPRSRSFRTEECEPEDGPGKGAQGTGYELGGPARAELGCAAWVQRGSPVCCRRGCGWWWRPGAPPRPVCGPVCARAPGLSVPLGFWQQLLPIRFEQAGTRSSEQSLDLWESVIGLRDISGQV